MASVKREHIKPLLQFIDHMSAQSTALIGMPLVLNSSVAVSIEENGAFPEGVGELILVTYQKLRSNQSIELAADNLDVSLLARSDYFSFMMTLRRYGIVGVRESTSVVEYFDALVYYDAQRCDEYFSSSTDDEDVNKSARLLP